MGSLRTRHVLLVLAAIGGGIVALRRRAPGDPVDVAPPSAPPPESVTTSPAAAPPQLPEPVELEIPPTPVAAPVPAWAQRRTAVPVERSSRRLSRAPLALAGIALAAVGLAVAVTLAGRDSSTPESPATTAAVLGTQTPEIERATEPQATTEPEPAAAAPTALPRATAATPLRARAAALLPVPDARLAELEGARAQGRVVRVDEVVGNRVFWVGTREERLLVHLQGPGTRWAVRRGQRISFTGVVTRTPRGAPARWGVQPVEGRTRLLRQRHHLEVWGPDIRFDCVAQCRGS